MQIVKYSNQPLTDQDTLHKNTLTPLDSLALIQGLDPKNDHIKSAKTSTDTFAAKSHITTEVQIKKSDGEIVTAATNVFPSFFAINPGTETIISDYQHVSWFSNRQNKVCYLIDINQGKKIAPIFSKVKVDATQITTKIFEIKEKPQNLQNWTFVPLVFGFITLAFVITLYRKQLGQIFERVISFFVSTKHSKEKSIHFTRFTVILDLLFILTFSLLVDRTVQKLGYYSPPLKFEYLVFVITSAFLMLLRILRWIIYKVAALFSNLNNFFSDLYANSTMHTRLLSIFLLPSVFLITYTTGFISTFLIYFSLIITLIVLIARIIRILRVFVDSGFSIFYFILYLCALEISPLLILGRVVISR